MTAPMRYHRFAVLLHWMIAGLILAILPIGFLMEDAPDAVKLQVYQLHKTIGISILFLSLIRLGWRLLNPPPAMVDTLKAWEKALSKLVHGLFYLLMLGAPLIGWAIVSTSSKGTPTMLFGQINWPHIGFLHGIEAVQRKQLHHLFEEMHEVFAFAIIGLLVLHVAAALKHQMLDKDGTMTRMVPGMMAKAQAPANKGRHGWALLALFAALFAGWVMIGGSNAPTNAPVTLSTGTTEITINWQVDMEQSQLGFGFVQTGNSLSGQFTRWRADIQFDPDHLEHANVQVAIDTGSATANDAEIDQSLPAPDWLNTAGFPQAIWSATHFTQTGPDTFLAKGELTLRGVSLPLDLPFQLSIKADGTAHMSGQTSLQRLAFGIGEGDDADAQWIEDTIAVKIQIVANPVD
ncbi:MAG: hypothetical protein COA47_11870 [Robiginitomaculum sp.]|nr:MAG: hypothetical protein COA47_11870 [Robiginitomaculum sp.]